MQSVLLYNIGAPKKATNLSINSDLLRMAKEARINLSQILEAELSTLLQEKLRREWQEENLEAIADYNRRVEGQGAFSDGLRRF